MKPSTLLAMTFLISACGGGSDSNENPTTDAAATTKKRLFVTSETFNGDFRQFVAPQGALEGGPEGADSRCNLAASNASLGSSWKAWVSAPSIGVGAETHAIDRIDDVGPWHLVGNDELAFANKQSLSNAPLVEIERNELGEVELSTAGVWTATAASGQRSGNSCDGWITGNEFFSAGQGNMHDATDWTSGTSQPCNGFGHLYCFEQ